MPTLNEALGGAPSSLKATLETGLDVLDLSQEIVFTKYVRVVLPLDGYIFWVKADILSSSAVLNSTIMNGFVPNGAAVVEVAADYIVAEGSLHYAIERQQNETESISVNSVTFTSKQRVEGLDAIHPNCIYVGEFEGIKFAFDTRGSYYRQADLHHYVGDALYPDVASQLITEAGQLDVRHRVVSNSLPLWLGLSFYQPFYGIGFPFQLYPSFLTPNNLRPPYGVVHIPPEATTALQSFPLLGKKLQHDQLAQDHVRVTLVGLRNDQAQDFVDCVNQYSQDYDNFGMMSDPIIRDEKRTQNEFSVLAIRKTIEYDVSYWQSRVRNVARQIVCQMIPTIQLAELSTSEEA